MAAFVGNNFDTVDLNGESQNQYGFVAQAGYRVTDAIEVFGRYEWYDILNASDTDIQTYNTTGKDVNNILTFGVNVYAMANVKWTTQVGISLGNMSGITNDDDTDAMTGAGWRNNVGTDGEDETQVNVITQLQVSF
jgi:hypothetical protein